MDNSFHEQGSRTQQSPSSLLVSLPILVTNLIKSLASLIQWTEEDQAEAGIFLDGPDSN